MKIEEVKRDATKYIVRLLCADCGKELNQTKPMTGEEVHNNWVLIVMGSGLFADGCPNKCRKTFSDLNINTKFDIVEATP